MLTLDPCDLTNQSVTVDYDDDAHHESPKPFV
jgi:hypothetical protein